ncbi:MAG: ArnT family glycosyltransferase [Thermoleophilaceae bacterium]
MSDRRPRAILDRGRAALSPSLLILGVVLLAGLAVRLANNDYGLPYVYSADEGSHFTNRAVEMFGGDPNPGYFQNPSAFTYLTYLALWLRDTGLWPVGPRAVPDQFAIDPTPIWVTGRTLAAVLCMAGVAGVFVATRRLWGTRAALAAAAVLSFAFLPVAYSRVAVTDVGTFLPVTLSVMWALAAHESGRSRDFLLSGAAAGIAVGFKYTAGLVLLPIVLAAALRARRDPKALVRAAGALGCAALALLATTPYLVLDLETARRQILAQAATAGGFGKVGQGGDVGVLYYLGSLGWGLGWVALGLTILGTVAMTRQSVGRAVVLVALPVALFAYLSLQSRYFGRWLLPAYPVLAVLAGVGAAWAADLLARPLARPLGGGAALAALGGVLVVTLAQPLAADLRSASVLGRTDTREVAREFLAERLRPSARVVIEPAVPSRYYRLVRRGRTISRNRKQFVRGFIKENRQSRLDYARTLRPETIDRYRRSGFCTVVTMSLLRGRAERDGERRALAYYRRLERESDLVMALDPYRPGAEPVDFHFDLSYNYYPRAFERPGPAIRVYRLSRCAQGFGQLRAGESAPVSEAAS